jgi:hypothetical protein
MKAVCTRWFSSCNRLLQHLITYLQRGNAYIICMWCECLPKSFLSCGLCELIVNRMYAFHFSSMHTEDSNLGSFATVTFVIVSSRPRALRIITRPKLSVCWAVSCWTFLGIFFYPWLKNFHHKAAVLWHSSWFNLVAFMIYVIYTGWCKVTWHVIFRMLPLGIL